MTAKSLSNLIILLFTAAFASAATRLVPDQYPNIQAAINDCNDGDTVIVAPGTYTGQGNRDIDFKGKAITVRSTDPNDPNIVAATIIDCNGTEEDPHRGFHFRNGEQVDSVLAGLTITNGQRTTSSGGAIRCYGSGTHPLVVNCVITGNSACMGGGVYCYLSGITLDACIISENSASSTTGGGIHSNESNIVLINCTITNNTTVAGGFRYGGGIYLSAGSGLISHCVIADNSAWRGGAITSSSKNLQVRHSFITDNFANQYGGALYLRGGGSTFNCCTIAGNSICSGNTINAYGDHVFSNCIIRGGIEERYTTVSYSNVEGGSPGEDNIDVDPLFVDANNGDYHLSPQSFCIDAGDPNYSPQPGETDIDGEPRLLGRRVDMGADEFSTISPAIIVVSPTAVQFTPLFESRPDSAQTTILILNRGIDKLNWRISETCPWLRADPIAGTAIVEPNEVTLTVDPRDLSKGTYHCDLTISDSNASNNPVVLPVSLEIIGPILSVGASELNFQANIENPIPPDQTLSLQNTGGGTLYWEITVPDESGWLTVYPPTGRSHGDVNEVALHVDASGLPAGYYTSELTITDPNAANSPQTIEVHLHLGLEPGWLYVPDEYPNIQTAIDWALPGDVVVIAPRTYTGPGNRDIDFLGKPITVRSIDPNDPDLVAATVIDCNGSENEHHRGFNFRTGEDANSILAGFTIINGYANDGAAIVCTKIGRGRSGEPGTAPVTCRIFNCIITRNTARYTGGGISIYMSSPTIFNCIITHNTARYTAGGMLCVESNPLIVKCRFSGNSCRRSGGAIESIGGAPLLANCTFTGNSGGRGPGAIGGLDSSSTVTNCIFWHNRPWEIYAYLDAPSLTYCNVQGGWPGIGNIDVDPLFVSPGYWDTNDTPTTYDDFWVDGDYHLKSEGWRRDTQRKMWTWDDITSRCIDAGNPGSPLGKEPLSTPDDPNNDWGVNVRINMGAYGGAAEASIPPHGWTIRTDYNNDGIVNFTDFACWSKNDAHTPTEPYGHLNPDPIDLALLADRWLEQTTWLGTLPPPTAASNPDPFDGATGVRTTPVLSWQPGFGAVSHDVYFGTINPPAFQRNQTETTFNPGTLNEYTTYSWRIDEVNSHTTTPGILWSFTTTHGGGTR